MSILSLLLCLLVIPLALIGRGQCCSTCAIASDDFNRSDDTDIDTGSSAGWTEDAGSWAIVSNTLQCTSAGIVICDTPHPDGDSTMVVEVDFRSDTSGQTCDVLAAVVDSNNYYYVRYTVAGGSGSIAIRRNNGGSHTQIAISSPRTININTTYAAKVCVDNEGRITASLDGTPWVYTAAQAAVTGTQAGLGATGSGTATFDNFVLTKSYDGSGNGCEKCEQCSNCDPIDSTPGELVVTISGMANNICSDCATLDGTYHLAGNGGGGLSCVWLAIVNTSKCAGAWTFAGVTATLQDASGTYILLVRIHGTGFSEFWRWEHNFGATKPDCSAWSALSLSFSLNSSNNCIASSATCHVTAA